MDLERNVLAIMPLVTTLGILGVLIFWLRYRARLRELLIRERIALIERGMVPAPELDPAGFERATQGRPSMAPRGLRYRTLGVTLVGLGLGVLLVISLAAGEARVGFGVGGAIVALGLAAIVNGHLLGREATGQDQGRPDTPATSAPRQFPSPPEVP